MRTAPYGDDPSRLLLVVTGEHFTPGTGDTRARFDRLAGWARRTLPGVELTHFWATQDNDPTDTVPLVGPLHPGARHAYVATGFGGWGMSGGMMAGRLLTARITGGECAWAGLYDPRRLASAVREAPAFLKHQAQVAQHFVGDRLRPSPPVEALPPGEGAVVRTESGLLAVYRDDDGALHAVSARCTHMGCLVGFNAAERAWSARATGPASTRTGRSYRGLPRSRWSGGTSEPAPAPVGGGRGRSEETCPLRPGERAAPPARAATATADRHPIVIR